MNKVDLHQADPNWSARDDDAPPPFNGHAPTSDGVQHQTAATEGQEDGGMEDGATIEDPELEALREILIGRYRRRAIGLEAELQVIMMIIHLPKDSMC